VDERKSKEELITQRIRDINGVPYATPFGYNVYGPTSDATNALLHDAIRCLEAGELEVAERLCALVEIEMIAERRDA
jgi:hypothetical protein